MPCGAEGYFLFAFFGLGMKGTLGPAYRPENFDSLFVVVVVGTAYDDHHGH